MPNRGGTTDARSSPYGMSARIYLTTNGTTWYLHEDLFVFMGF